MYLPKSLAIRIIEKCKIEDRGTHKVHGWDKYFDSYFLDGIKVTVDQKSKSPREKTRRSKLIQELQKRAQSIKTNLNISWSGHIGSEISIVDPYGVLPLIKKYCLNTHIDLPY